MENLADKKMVMELEDIVLGALQANIFTDVSVGFSIYRNNKWLGDILNYDSITGKQKKVSAKFFDFASLTKPLVTSLSLLRLIEEGKVFLNSTIGEIFNQIEYPHSQIKVVNLLNHRSGLPAHREFFHDLRKIPTEERANQIQMDILSEPLLFSPGENELYSDLGYIILGQIIEHVSGQRLDRYFEKNILSLLRSKVDLCFRPTETKKRKEYAKTGRCVWSGKILEGIVHDDNCRSLSGISGHAGLFGTAFSLLTFLQHFLDEKNVAHKKGIPGKKRIFTEMKKRGENRWVMGFDTPSKTGSSSGNYFSDATLGHLGFTGTSFWVDTKRKAIIVLLTNRVLMSSDLTGIQSLRPAIHDCIMKRLTN